MTRDTKVAIAIFFVVVLILLGLAGYGYLTGAWNQPPI